ncbi:Gfo/Idh/MocA family protein [Numidum massiliense]|uniref:Gfo/Idh/MocA family protein n=1 Tax=Numidum massiliense TaxID=1522315 RepID=UPI0006D579D8|nr:Gfo/Idh/MocA family oxidoreductase [Numidum massiliense]
MIKAALIGAGSRGAKRLASYALRKPHDIQFVAVAEPNETRRREFAEQHRIPEEGQFTSWEEMLALPRLCEAILICTNDDLHFQPTMRALDIGYHILLEKPMANDPLETLLMAEKAKEKERLLLIAHVLRYSPFFIALKELLEDEVIGNIVTIQWNENVVYWHQAHSYVRGNWGNRARSSPMILAKCCHDTDILQWLVGDECEAVSSFGGLAYFHSGNAPEGAAERCIDGCAVEATCQFSALKWYYNEIDDWPQNVVSDEPTLEARWQALAEGPYGRCVFYCDNDVVDHQVMNLRFKNGVTVAFTMAGFSTDESDTRTFKVMGTKGEIRGHMEKNIIEVRDFTGKISRIHPEQIDGDHGGGDYNLMKDFVNIMQSGNFTEAKSSGEESARSHMIAFAAEHSRLTGEVVSLNAYMKAVREGIYS